MSDRRKQNLEGLLKFCVENTASEDPTTQSDVNNDPECTKWLQEALSAFAGDDETAIIKKCLEILASPPGKLSSDPEEDFMTRENAFEQLESVVDNIDNAKDCYKLGGLEIFLEYLKDSCSSSLQWRSLFVLGLCLQNNTFCQNQALKLNILPKLLEMVDSDFSDSQVNVKALYALGALIRGHEEAERQFITSNGFSYLLRALHRNVPKLTVKTIFLISNLTEDKQENLETLYSMGMVEQMISIIQGPHNPHHEHVLNILLKLLRSYPSALKECRQERYGLKQTLENRKQYLQETDPEAFQEEINFCDQLNKLCFSDKFEILDATDR